MTGPAITFTAEFTPGSPVDIYPYMRNAFTITRGKSAPSITSVVSEAGNFHTVLANKTRIFDPTFTTGTYFGKVLPGVKFHVSANYATVDYPQFTGTATGWPQTYPEHKADQIVTLDVADAIRTIAQAKLLGFVAPPEHTGARINRVLDAIGWPALARSISVGKTFQPNVRIDKVNPTNAWQLCVDAANAEWGNLYIDPLGSVIFMDRKDIILNANYSTSKATFGDGGGTEIPISDLTVALDDSMIANDGKLTWNAAGGYLTKSDAVSIASFGDRTWQEANYMMQCDARAFVDWVVLKNANPALRIDTLTVHSTHSPALAFPKTLSLDIGDRITVKVTPHGGGARISRDVFIHGITHEVTSSLWTTTYTLDDAQWTLNVGLFDHFNMNDGHVVAL